MFRRFRHTLLTRHLTTRRLGYLLGGLITVGVGLLLHRTQLGDGLTRLSYDLPFIFRKTAPEDLVLIYFDADVKRRLQQPVDKTLNRSFHARLLERLARDGAKLVLFDVLFTDAAADPRTDQQFAQAIRQQGRVVLSAEAIQSIQGSAWIETTEPPMEVLREAAAGFGLANVHDDKADSAIRQIESGTEATATAPWVAAELLGAEVTRHPGGRHRERWLNYYCLPRNLITFNLDQAILPGGLPEGRFRDKLVVVGARPEALSSAPQREEFANPYSRFGGALSPGASIHALTLLNLLRGDWLIRLSPRQEDLLFITWGMLISVLLMRLPPWYAIVAAMTFAAGFAFLAAYTQLRWHFWFAWAIPAFTQTAAAMTWSVGYQYLDEVRKRERLRRAVAAYVSPHVADKLVKAKFDLSPGGREVEATIMFTDLENFTKLSEGLSSSEISRILTAYFNETSRVILDQEGTVLKLIGDGVMAAWGAPLPDPNPAERAVAAALKMRDINQMIIAGRTLRTRVGVNTGLVLAGNLGTEAKFDYTLIGDPINVASRLESLNKQLGTDILISGITRAGLGNQFQLRDLGRFVLSGKANAVGVFEVLGFAGTADSTTPWLEPFQEARGLFINGDFERAALRFEEVIRIRPAGDGPSRFFLDQIATRMKSPQADGWEGVIRLDAK